MKTDNFLVYLSKTSITIKFSLPLILPIDWYFLDNKCFTIFFTPMVAKVNFWWTQFFKNFVEPNKFCQSDCTKASIERKPFFQVNVITKNVNFLCLSHCWQLSQAQIKSSLRFFEAHCWPSSMFSIESQAQARLIYIREKEGLHAKAKYWHKLNPGTLFTFFPTYSLHNHLLGSPWYIAHIISTILGKLIRYGFFKCN